MLEQFKHCTWVVRICAIISKNIYVKEHSKKKIPLYIMNAQDATQNFTEPSWQKTWFLWKGKDMV